MQGIIWCTYVSPWAMGLFLGRSHVRVGNINPKVLRIQYFAVRCAYILRCMHIRPSASPVWPCSVYTRSDTRQEAAAPTPRRQQEGHDADAARSTRLIHAPLSAVGLVKHDGLKNLLQCHIISAHVYVCTNTHARSIVFGTCAYSSI